MALEEDLGGEPSCEPLPWGDVTTSLLIPQDLMGRAVLVARQPGVLAGLETVGLVCEQATRGVGNLQFELLLEDGAELRAGSQLAVLSGPMHFILPVERTALNFVQHLSGIATVTRRYVDAVAGLRAQILDTRKTTPGWRILEKYAVRCGGGHNHRFGLHDAILIKDNHLAALAGESISSVIQRARQATGVGSAVKFIEVEVDTLKQLDEALPAKPDIVLLDNMSLDQMREAVQRRDAIAPNVLLEASGGITLETVRAIAETGVDRISVGALTHSAPALDIGLDFEAMAR
jgi:nicotinate-nucleotide pyrophosphorylase (carboxylating)